MNVIQPLFPDLFKLPSLLKRRKLGMRLDVFYANSLSSNDMLIVSKMIVLILGWLKDIGGSLSMISLHLFLVRNIDFQPIKVYIIRKTLKRAF